MKKRLISRCGSVLGLILTLVAPSLVLAYRSGPPPGANGSTASGGTSCRICHGSSTGPGSVQIIGFPTQYLANTLYDLDVRVQDSTKFGAGFQISFETTTGAHVGTIIRTDTAGTQLNSGWLNHTSTGVNNSVANWFSMGSAAEYHLRWRAPAADLGPIRAWAAGNAINNNFSNSGDIIYLANQTATFTVARGACCDESAGTCTEDVLQADCIALDDRYGGDGSTCATITPPCFIVGACCDTSPGAGGPEPEGACNDDVLQGDCVGPQRAWTKATACADLNPPCLETPGACCDTLDGTCADGMYFGDCQGDHRTWTKGTSCSDLLCDATLGACCDHDPFGGCTETTNDQCRCDQCTWHKLMTCGQIECLHNPIPTMSQWGVVVLTLLLLTAAKVHFGRRSEAALSNT